MIGVVKRFIMSLSDTNNATPTLGRYGELFNSIPLDTLIIAHTVRFVKRISQLFLHIVTFSFGDSADLLGYSPGSCYLSP
jgi:hypothetical protein